MATTTTSTGFPDATNTGVPAGVTLSPSGSLTVTKAGTVISGLDIKGTVYINAPNVTIENCKITGSTDTGVVNIASGVTGATVKNCTISGTGANNDGSHGINGQGTFIGNNISGVENGLNISGASTIQGNYIHDLKASGSPHYDGIQIDGGESNVSISHNTVINEFGQTSAVMIDNYFGPISNIKVDNNLLSGGGYTVYSDAQFSGGSISGVSFTNNHMGSGQYGYTDFNGNSPTYTGNVNDGASLIKTLNTSANVGSTTAPGATGSNPGTGETTTGSTGTPTTGSATTTTGGTPTDGSTTTHHTHGGWHYHATTAATKTTTATTTAASPADAAAATTAATTDATGTKTAASTTDSTSTTSASGHHVELTGAHAHGHQALIKGVADAGSPVSVYDGAAQVGTATADASGHWTFKSSSLSDAVHTFAAKEVDSAGHVASASSGAAIVGSSGANTLTGTSGNDVFVGNGHPDTFVFAQNFGHDVIKDFHASGANHDTIQLSTSAFADFNTVLSHAQQVGHDVVISSGADSLTLKHTSVGGLSAQDFHFA